MQSKPHDSLNGTDSFLNESISKAFQSDLAGPSINKFQSKSSSSFNQCNQAVSKILESAQKPSEKSDKDIKTDFDNSDIALNSILQSSGGNLDKNVKSLKQLTTKVREKPENILDSLREQLMAEEGLLSNHTPFELDASNINRDSNPAIINKPKALDARLFDYEPTHIEGYKVADLSMSM
jgi:hypothetical protein